MKNSSSPKIIADYMNIVGEGPIWHALDKLFKNKINIKDIK